MRRRVLLVSPFAGLAQGQSAESPFSLDPLRPYAYIEFDRIGPGEPMTDGESRVRIWLRLMNNSKWPITVGVYEPGHGAEGWALLHEVVEVIGASSDQSPRESIPTGYGTADLVSSTDVAPGKAVGFSVPQNHIRPDWYVRVRFEFRLRPTRSGRQPHSFVDLVWTDLPKGVQQQLRPRPLAP